jgi:hypothetical protein
MWLFFEEKATEHLAFWVHLFGFCYSGLEGGFFLRKKPLSGLPSVYSNSENAITPSQTHQGFLNGGVLDVMPSMESGSRVATWRKSPMGLGNWKIALSPWKNRSKSRLPPSGNA